jgi:hypothetical protein
VSLPPVTYLSRKKLEPQLQARDPKLVLKGNASKLVWLRCCQAGYQIEIACLGLRTARILHLPGESFVEYQLAAKALRPESFVAVAVYGDYAPWYIGTAIAYELGGYETSPSASNVAPEVEGVLSAAMHKLLQSPP